MINFDLKKCLEKIDRPKMFLHGDKDVIAPYGEAKKIFRYAKELKKFLLIRRAGHNFDESKKIRKEYVTSVCKWFNKYL